MSTRTKGYVLSEGFVKAICAWSDDGSREAILKMCDMMAS